MKQPTRVSAKFLIFILVGLLIVFTNNHRALSNQKNSPKPEVGRQQLLRKLPQSFKNCLPKFLEKGKIISSYKQGNERYFLIFLRYSEPANSTNVIFQLSNNICQAITPLKNLGVDSLLRYVEKEIVLALSLQKYQNLANEFGGFKALEKALIESHKYGSGHDEIYYPIEDVLALKQLGINIPASPLIFIVSPEGIYGLGENNQYKLIRPFN